MAGEMVGVEETEEDSDEYASMLGMSVDGSRE